MAASDDPAAAGPFATLPMPPDMAAPAVTRAWADHVMAGRIGEPSALAPAGGGDRGLAGLAAILVRAAHRRLP